MKSKVKEIQDMILASGLDQELKDGIVDRLQDQEVEIKPGTIIVDEVDPRDCIDEGIFCESDACSSFLRRNGFDDVDADDATEFIQKHFEENTRNINYRFMTEDDFLLKE